MVGEAEGTRLPLYLKREIQHYTNSLKISVITWNSNSAVLKFRSGVGHKNMHSKQEVLYCWWSERETLIYSIFFKLKLMLVLLILSQDTKTKRRRRRKEEERERMQKHTIQPDIHTDMVLPFKHVGNGLSWNNIPKLWPNKLCWEWLLRT